MPSVSLNTLYIAVFGITFVLELLLVERLKRSHSSLYRDLGEPKFGDSNLGRSAWKLQKFIYSLDFLALKDPMLSFLSIGAILGSISLIILFFGLSN
jgi:hypothetical protein